MKTESLIGIISLISGIISLGLAIYLTKDTALPVGYAITLVLSALIFFVYSGYNRIGNLEKINERIDKEIQQFKENINVYSRLAKIENKVFKEGDKK